MNRRDFVQAFAALASASAVPSFAETSAADAFDAAAPRGPDGYADLTSPNYQYPGTPNNSVEGTTRSYSVVVHTPRLLRERLPLGMSLSAFYNESSNFEPAASNGVLCLSRWS